MSSQRVVVVMPAYNAARTLERIYHDIPPGVAVPTRYFEEASSINFRRGVPYGLAPLNVLRRYLLHRAGLRRNPQFSKPLNEVISPYHRDTILKTPNER